MRYMALTMGSSYDKMLQDAVLRVLIKSSFSHPGTHQKLESTVYGVYCILIKYKWRLLLCRWAWCLPCGFDHVVPYFYVIYFGALLGEPLHTTDFLLSVCHMCWGLSLSWLGSPALLWKPCTAYHMYCTPVFGITSARAVHKVNQLMAYLLEQCIET